MVALSRNVKIWTSISIASLLGYVAYVFRGSIEIIIGYLNNVQSDVWYVNFTGAVFWVGDIGLVARLAGTMLGLAAIYMLWIEKRTFPRVKNLIAVALILEGVNFIALLPSLPFLFEPSGVTSSLPLAWGYVLQILFTVPFLWTLAAKVLLYREPAQKSSLLKFAAVAFIAYAIVLFANEFSRWASMIFSDTNFLGDVRIIGFLNAVALMPFAVIFAVAGAWRLWNGRITSAMGWLGASLAVIGLNYSILLAYSYFTNSLKFLALVDIWTIPLLGLGVTLMLNSRHQS